jgi:ribosome-binding factor A
LKEVISEVIQRDVRDPRLTQFISITRVDITADLQHAKVYVSMIGTEQEKKQALEALQSAAGFIAVQSSKKVVMRYFPVLNFKIDNSVDQLMRIDELLGKIHEEQKTRKPTEDSTSDE